MLLLSYFLYSFHFSLHIFFHYFSLLHITRREGGIFPNYLPLKEEVKVTDLPVNLGSKNSIMAESSCFMGEEDRR